MKWKRDLKLTFPVLADRDRDRDKDDFWHPIDIWSDHLLCGKHQTNTRKQRPQQQTEKKSRVKINHKSVNRFKEEEEDVQPL